MISREQVEAIRIRGGQDYEALAPYRVNVPVDTAGPWSIERFTTQFDINYMRFVREGRAPGLGTFTRLVYEGRETVMSDTNAELADLVPYIHKLRGNVLVTGLGIGVVLHILTKVPDMSRHTKSITVVEIDRYVLKLVKKHYERSDKRIKIIHADARKWEPPKGTKYDAAWHDIWNTIDEDNRADMTALVKHYSRFVRARQQYCWGRDTMDRERRVYG